MSEARRIVLEGGEFDGHIYDLQVEDYDRVAPTFNITINGVTYRTVGETDKNGREVMVYDG